MCVYRKRVKLEEGCLTLVRVRGQTRMHFDEFFQHGALNLTFSQTLAQCTMHSATCICTYATFYATGHICKQHVIFLVGPWLYPFQWQSVGLNSDLGNLYVGIYLVAATCAVSCRTVCSHPCMHSFRPVLMCVFFDDSVSNLKTAKVACTARSISLHVGTCKSEKSIIYCS